MIRSFIFAVAVCGAIASSATAGFELQVSLRGQAPSGMTVFESGGVGNVLELDLLLVENTGVAFSAQSAILEFNRTAGPAMASSANVQNGFGAGGPASGSDPSFLYTNTIGNESSISAGGFEYVKVGQLDLVPASFSPSTFEFVENAPGAAQFRIDNANLDPAPQTQIFASSNSITVAVPEPSSALLLGVVGIGAVMRRRRS